MKKLLLFFPVLLLFISCEEEYNEPQIPLNDYKLETGFSLNMVASEPLLKAPVAMDFDNQGRMWVTQMPGYMNDLRGTGEKDPTGSIVILEDLDHDGVMDHTKVFLDSLVMPRALAHVYGGLLYAEPPFLYFTEIENDKPVNRVVVDSIYAVEGNPEHQPNGLLFNVDNWIYNAKSNFRYRRINGVWKKEPTTYRGQWGISHDDFGRLYYNDNSRQLIGDHVLPNRLTRNKYFTPHAGVNQLLTKDQRVYPIHPTTVNRGYGKGILNKDSLLLKVTAACSPLLYRGGAFPEAYDQNVFVAVPEANLIKRNILTFTGDSTIAEQAYNDKEFLASTDEGFRPVNLYNGPNGDLYIVDMHRGMIGHHAYLSPYLKKKVEKNRLDTLTNFGRILKVSQTNKTAQKVLNFTNLKSAELVTLLKDNNGWVRDRAQQQLILKNDSNVVPEIQKLGLTAPNWRTKIHALYTLEGLNNLSFNYLASVIKDGDANTIAHALILLENYSAKTHEAEIEEIFNTLISQNNKTLDLYLASSLGAWHAYAPNKINNIAKTILERHPNANMYREALISGFKAPELELLRNLAATTPNDTLAALTAQVVENQAADKVNRIYSLKTINEDTRTSGAKMFYEICASCHGANGQGIEGLAPPLMGSEHVANTERLARIILHGLEGPLTVSGVDYNLNLAMPGLIRNSEITNKDITDIISYVTNAFNDHPKGISEKKVQTLRETIPASGTEYTMEELEALDNQ